MANDSKGKEGESPASETGEVKGEEVKKVVNKVTNGAKATSVQTEPKEEKNVKTEGKTALAARTYVISAEEMEEFKMMKAVLATRQGKALFLDYLEGDIGRYFYLGRLNNCEIIMPNPAGMNFQIVPLLPHFLPENTSYTPCFKVCGHD